MKRIAVCVLCLFLILLFAACRNEIPEEESNPKEETTEPSVDMEKPSTEESSADPVKNSLGSLESFCFSLTWNTYGISSYDSTTGKLVKSSDATHPEEYTTTYFLTDEQKQQIYDWIKDLQVTDYPDTYNPHPDGLMSNPSMTLILSVHTDTVQKTIQAKDIAITNQSTNEKGQNFLTVCKNIEQMLTETEEWKALPEYEFLYD